MEISHEQTENTSNVDNNNNSNNDDSTNLEDLTEKLKNLAELGYGVSGLFKLQLFKIIKDFSNNINSSSACKQYEYLRRHLDGYLWEIYQIIGQSSLLDKEQIEAAENSTESSIEIISAEELLNNFEKILNIIEINIQADIKELEEKVAKKQIRVAKSASNVELIEGSRYGYLEKDALHILKSHMGGIKAKLFHALFLALIQEMDREQKSENGLLNNVVTMLQNYHKLKTEFDNIKKDYSDLEIKAVSHYQKLNREIESNTAMASELSKLKDELREKTTLIQAYNKQNSDIAKLANKIKKCQSKLEATKAKNRRIIENMSQVGDESNNNSKKELIIKSIEQQLEEDVKKLESTIEEHKKNHDDLLSEFKKFKQINVNLEAEITEKNKQLEQLQETLDNEAANIAVLSGELSGALTDHEKTKSGFNQKIQFLDSNLTLFRNNLKELEDERQRLINDIQIQEKKSTELQKKLYEEKLVNNGANQAISEQKTRLLELQKKNKELENKVEAVSKKAKDIETEYEALKKSHEAFKELYNKNNQIQKFDKDMEIQNKDSQIKKLKDELEKNKKIDSESKVKTSQTISSLQSKIKNFETENAKLLTERKNRELTITNQNSEIKNLKSDSEKKESERSVQEKEYNKLKGQYTTLKDTFDFLQNAIAQNDTKSIAAKVTSLTETVEKKDQEIQKLKDQLNSLIQKNSPRPSPLPKKSGTLNSINLVRSSSANNNNSSNTVSSTTTTLLASSLTSVTNQNPNPSKMNNPPQQGEQPTANTSTTRTPTA